MSKNKQPIIHLNNISKKYQVQGEDFFALNNVDLQVYPGDRIGIIGPNGSGKSTLLKIISGIVTPTSGSIKVRDNVAAIMHLDSGFHPELTGVENIYINGLLLGMSRQDIHHNFHNIVDYADIGPFINNPFYTYSSGMKFRLAFAIAFSSPANILIIDEVMVSGDLSFQEKTLSTIKKMQSQKHITTITCSHVPYQIWELSDTFYELKRGKIDKVSKIKVVEQIKNRSTQWRKMFPIIKKYRG